MLDTTSLMALCSVILLYRFAIVQGAVFTAVLSVLLGIVNMLRWKWTTTNQFYMMTCSASMFAGGITTFHLSYVAGKAAFYALALATIGASSIILTSWFVFPVTTGYVFRNTFASALRSLADAVACVEDIIIPAPTEGTRATSDSCVPPAGMNGDRAFPARSALITMRQSLISCHQLKLPARLELDVYHSPKRFPLAAFSKARTPAWQAMSTWAVMIRLLRNENNMDLGVMRREPLQLRLQTLMDALQAVLRGMAGAVSKRVPFAEVDDAMEALDSAWANFITECSNARASPETIRDSAGGEEEFAVHILSVLLYIFGAQIRVLYALLPATLVGRDADAPSIAARRLEYCPGWIRPSEAFHVADLVENDAHATIDVPGVLDGPRQLSTESLSRSLSRTLSHRQSTVEDIINSFEIHNTYTTNIYAERKKTKTPVSVLGSVWRLPIEVLFGIQFGIVIATALGLGCWNAFSEKVVSNADNVIGVVVSLTWMPAIGDVTVRTLYRLGGMVAAAAWTYIAIALADSVGGIDWSNTGTFIVASIMNSLWVGFCMMNQVRYSRYQYLWAVGGMTVPIALMTNARSGADAPWDLAGYKLVAMLIAICVVWLALLVVLPVSVRQVAVANLAASLDAMAEFVERMPTEVRRLSLIFLIALRCFFCCCLNPN